MRTTVLIALVAIAGAAEPNARLAPLPPKISIAAGERPIELAAARYEVAVHGLVAETTVTLTFRNPNPRALEGTLELPLPDGATICAYALDVGGRLVDAVPVTRDAARVIAESEMRRGVDPGLVEHVAGNAFRTRIFPLPANGTRTARLTWADAIAVHGDEAAVRVPLPRCALPSLDLRVEIAGAASEPRVEGFGNLTLTRWRDGRAAEAHFADATPGDDLVVRLPALPPATAQVESRDGERFVAIAARAPARPTPAGRAAPARIAIAWDASGSRTVEGAARGRAALAALAKRWSSTAFDLVVFRDAPAPPVACADAAALDRALADVAYDGGTAMAALDLRRAALPDARDAAWIVVGDGIATLDAGLPRCDDVPVDAVLVETARDAASLAALAARTGGSVVDAAGVDADDVAAAIAEPPPRLLRVGGGAALADVEVVDQGARCLVLARVLADADVDLVFDTGTVRTAVRVADAVPGGAIARAWAGRVAAQLAAFPEEQAGALADLGRRYGVVTPRTSLLVLENLDQYVRHGVEPPASWPELREQYAQRLKQRGQEWQDRAGPQLERVVAQWQQQVAWWEGRGPRAIDDGVTVARAAVVPAALASAPTAAPSTPAPAVAANRQMQLGEDEADLVPEITLDSASERLVDNDRTAAGSLAAVGAARPAIAGGARFRSISSGGYAKKAADIDGGDGIAMAGFDPNTPYLAALRAAPAAEREAVYLRQRPGYVASPSFFVDCAAFFQATDPRLARRILSNLAELRIDDPALTRIHAWRLRELGDLDGAVRLLRRVARIRPEEPQSWRDLAIALAERGEARGAAADVEEAMRLLLGVALRRPPVELAVQAGDLDEGWNRFPGIEVIALEELNRLIARVERGGFERAPAIPTLDPRLRRTLDVDVRVVLAWDRDMTDIDLHVLEPAGEEAFYGHRFTAAGGTVSPDCTRGYGPEEYLVRRAATGSYAIRCHYFGSRANTLFGPATCIATVYRDWGRASERRETILVRLDQQKETVAIGDVRFGDVPLPAAAGPTRAMVAALKRGMARTDVEAALGAPQRVDHAGTTTLVYALRDGGDARIALAPELVSAREVVDGAERDLLVR